ncbi:SusC/RagA family TonB-linked outer membrane protein [Adhaeribacter pallidiroseus]|uniref:TonB-dependent receptor SusC n=1 Tax=Adhaeribacter pallidiroseus TaxID=2072847 RepID=A0A369QP93_9BACT|nr:TonB-dependent receptor [Adhaeribacter pallidiroseus]RDC65495.1 TonB-dependent receptor SusC [Adhaeribacter pallidiroseus]
MRNPLLPLFPTLVVFRSGRCWPSFTALFPVLVFALLVYSSRLYAQTAITGTVSGTGGEALPGVTVILKGSTNGTTTDVGGNYTLSIPAGQENGTLTFSFIGYTSQDVAINNRTTVNVTLAEDTKALQEVVVIGYQTVRKQDLTGAVSVINPAAANRVSTNSVVESLQGLAPGVNVRSGGAPGQMSRIEIRGAASFANTDPLYVIDGMIADANTTINNNDIASIQVLKDASAAAIYGSRAANGVVIITTKQGKEGPAQISASAKYGIQQIPTRWDVMNATEFAATQRTQYQNSGLTPPVSVGTGFNPAIDTDWQDEVMQTGNIQDYNLSLSGGSQTATYLISGSYFTNKGVLKGHDFKRGSLRVNTRSTKGRVTFGENLVITNTNSKAPSEGNPFYDMPQMLPTIAVQGPQYVSPTNPEGYGFGTLDAVTYASNPVAIRNLAQRTDNFAKLVGNAYLDVKIVEGLNYKFNTGAEVSFDFTRNLRKVGIWRLNNTAYPSSVNEDRSRYLNLLFEHTLNFNKTFGVHNINGVVGISQQHITREVTSGGRSNLQIYNNQYQTTIGSATGLSSAGGGVPVDYRTYGYLGRINYTYNDKYLLTLTGRVDQDSRFGENYRTGFFPSVAAGWRISKEGFFNAAWVTDLKLNASYGELGIVPLNSWDYTAYINSGPRAVFGSDQTAYVGTTQARLANPDLKWEERIVRNIGIDASFFNNQLSVSLEAYNSLSKDNLLALTVGGYLGNLGGYPFVNAGSIRNKGIEFSATYRSSQNAFKWDVSGNFTTIRNTVESVGDQGGGINYIQVGNTRTQIGRSLGEWFLLKTDGLFQTQEEVNNHTTLVNGAAKQIQPNAKPGDVKYIDQNGDGAINADDRVFAGSPWPKLQTGAQFNGSYGPFSINIQLVGVFGNTIYNDVRTILDSYQLSNFRSDINPWRPDNTDTEDPRLGVNTEPGIIDNNLTISERWIENGSYVRLRNLELGYNIPETLLRRGGIQNARVFVSGQNLFTITKYSGLDPDVVGNTDPNNGQARILERGVDFGNWPASRLISTGLQFGF